MRSLIKSILYNKIFIVIFIHFFLFNKKEIRNLIQLKKIFYYSKKGGIKVVCYLSM